MSTLVERPTGQPAASVRTVLAASLVGTTVELRERDGTVSVPAAHLFRTRGHRRGLVAGMLARWAEGAAFNTWGVFIITYATVTAKVDKVVVLLGVTFGALLMAALTPVGGGTLWWAGGYLVLTAVISLVAVATMPRFVGWRPAWAADARW